MRVWHIGLAALAGTAALSLAAVQAQDSTPFEMPGAADPARVTGGTYAVDPSHTQILFSYSHFGLSRNIGVLSGATGTLALDPAAPQNASVSIEVPVATITSAIPRMDEEFRSDRFFDVAQFPTAKFQSTSVTVDGTSAKIAGDLTIHGVTKPVVIDAEFFAAGPNPFKKVETVSFTGTMDLNRSDFGLGASVPLVSDEVQVTIMAAFEKQG